MKVKKTQLKAEPVAAPVKVEFTQTLCVRKRGTWPLGDMSVVYFDSPEEAERVATELIQSAAKWRTAR